LLERFHQTLKREEVYWQLCDHLQDAREKLSAFRSRNNAIRPNWALEPAEGGDVLTPKDVYINGRAITLPRRQGWGMAAKQRLDESMQQDAKLKQAAPPGADLHKSGRSGSKGTGWRDTTSRNETRDTARQESKSPTP
jgi:hypothetical protein